MLLARLFDRKDRRDGNGHDKTDRGILVFENTSEVIQVERVLKEEGWKIRVMGPPPGIQSGCQSRGSQTSWLHMHACCLKRVCFH